MGIIPVSILGQNAENMLAYLIDLTKMYPQFTIKYTLPIGNGQHIYQYHYNGESITHTSQFAGNPKVYDSGPWHGKQNVQTTLAGAVGAAYYHGGSLWFIAEGKEEQLKAPSKGKTLTCFQQSICHSASMMA